MLLTIRRIEEIPSERFVASIGGEVNAHNDGHLWQPGFPNGTPTTTSSWDDVVDHGFQEIVLDLKRLKQSNGVFIGLLIFLINEQEQRNRKLVLQDPPRELVEELTYQQCAHRIEIRTSKKVRNG